MVSELWQIAAGVHYWAKQLELPELVNDFSEYVDDVVAPLGGTLRRAMQAVAYGANQGEPELALTDSVQEQLAKVLGLCGMHTIGVDTSTETVIIYTRKPVTKKLLKGLPERFENGSRLAVRPLRPFTVGSAAPVADSESAAMVTKDGRYTCGSSIGMGTVRDAGTLGALVEDSTNTLFGLSCCHVVGGCGKLPPRTPILAPGVMDVESGSINPFTIGRFERALDQPPVAPSPNPVRNNDAALFRVLNPTTVTSWQRSAYDTPIKTLTPASGMKIEKVGRTTGVRTNTLGSRLAELVPIRYNTVVFTGPRDTKGQRINQTVFYDPIFLVEATPDQPFSLPGDSGALVTTEFEGTRYAIGMVVGGDNKTISLIVPIAPILKELGVELVQTGGPP